ncbi:MAG: glycine cleavage system protein T, partial [Chloroflexi bacterium]|nr:glycine cleavage system protein T [Chloroflexota bacterium]
VSRTGYTGEPVGFELFLPSEQTLRVWQRLVATGESLGIRPIGLGARDTLRLEAGLTLFGHELGLAPDGTRIPIFAAPSASVAVNLTADRGDFIGRGALEAQAAAYQSYRQGTVQPRESLPRLIRPLAILGSGVARQGDEVYWNGQRVGWVTSGTVVPYWVFTGQDADAVPTDETGRRAIALGYIDAEIPREATVEVNVRGRALPARVVRRHGRSDLPPYFRPIV